MRQLSRLTGEWAMGIYLRMSGLGSNVDPREATEARMTALLLAATWLAHAESPWDLTDAIDADAARDRFMAAVRDVWDGWERARPRRAPTLGTTSGAEWRDQP